MTPAQQQQAQEARRIALHMRRTGKPEAAIRQHLIALGYAVGAVRAAMEALVGAQSRQ